MPPENAIDIPNFGPIKVYPMHATKPLGSVKTGLTLILMSIVLSFVIVASLIVFLIVSSEVNASRATEDAMLRNGAFLLVGASLLGYVGNFVCARAPRETGAGAYMLGSIVASFAAVGLFVAQWLAEMPSYSHYVAGVLEVAASLLFLLFLKQMAVYVKRDDLSKTAVKSIVVMLIVVALAALSTTVTLPAIAALGVGISTVVLAIWLLSKYLHLIVTLRAAM